MFARLVFAYLISITAAYGQSVIVAAKVSTLVPSFTAQQHVIVQYSVTVRNDALRVEVETAVIGNELKIVFRVVTGGNGFPPSETVTGQVDFGMLNPGSYQISLYTSQPETFSNSGVILTFSTPKLSAQAQVAVGSIASIPTLNPASLVGLSLVLMGMALETMRRRAGRVIRVVAPAARQLSPT